MPAVVFRRCLLAAFLAAAPAAAQAPPPAEPPGGSVGEALFGRGQFHGNFCGVAQRPEATAAIDALDEACKRHDDCYDTSGRRACDCDRQLKRDAVAIANSPAYSVEIRRRAGVIAQAAEVMDCTP